MGTRTAGHHSRPQAPASLLAQPGSEPLVACSLHPMRRGWPEKHRDCNRRRRDTGAPHGPLAAGRSRVAGQREQEKGCSIALAHTMPSITHLPGDDIAVIICELLLSHLLSREVKDFVPLQQQEGFQGAEGSPFAARTVHVTCTPRPLSLALPCPFTALLCICPRAALSAPCSLPSPGRAGG